MAAADRQDALTKNYKENWDMGKIIGQSDSKSPLAVMFNITAMMTPNISCANNPTVRSESERLRSKSRKIGGIDEAFCNPRITRMFPKIATKEHINFKTQICKTKLLWRWTSCTYSSILWVQKSVIMSNLIIFRPTRRAQLSRILSHSRTKAEQKFHLQRFPVIFFR